MQRFMCIFCVGDDTPFYLRKSTAFPRKVVAEAIETDMCDKTKAASESCPEQEATTAQPKIFSINAFRRRTDA